VHEILKGLFAVKTVIIETNHFQHVQTLFIAAKL